MINSLKNINNLPETIFNSLEQRRSHYWKMAMDIWEYAELGLEESRSAGLLCNILEQEGFRVETGLGGLATAFSGSYGSGGPVIAFLGEFDALPGLSQKAAWPIKEPVASNANGHGCGHNLIGLGSLAAAAALKDYLKASGVEGTVRYYGCPGEERGAGKTIMAKAGCFSDVDAVFCWHPMDANMVESRTCLSSLCTTFKFNGRSSHASASPHLGRSALDAVELMNVGSNFLREHVIPQARIHYAITNAGGDSPNVVQAEAEVKYEVRAPHYKDVLAIQERIFDIARGAALMAGVTFETLPGDQYKEFIPNQTLNYLLYEALALAGPPLFNEDDVSLAKEFAKTLSPESRANSIEEIKEATGKIISTTSEEPLSQAILPYKGNRGLLPCSTDVGDISALVPTAQLYTACCALGTPAHSWQKTAQSGSGIGREGMMAAAKTMSLAGAMLLNQAEIIKEAKLELADWQELYGKQVQPEQDGKIC